MKKTAVILTTLGGPRSSGEIPDFIKRFVGKELPPPVMRAIIDRYKLIGGYSPLCEITDKQAELLGKSLESSYLCIPAFRYVSPFIEESIDMAINSGAERIIFLILSPFYASVTTGNYIDTAIRYLSQLKLSLKTDFIHSWYNNEKFVNCWSEKIKEEVQDWDSFFIFSAHSLPERFIHEPYKKQIEELTERVANLLNLKNYALGWQSIPSQVKEPWIEPTVETIMDRAKAQGFSGIIQVPIGFTADHIETLYDIDICHREYAKKISLNFNRVSSLNTDERFIYALVDIINTFSGEN